MREKEIETQILTWLNYQSGCYAFKINTVGIFDPQTLRYRKITNQFIAKGTSDILGLYRGLFFAFEVKTPKRKKNVSVEQIQFIAQVRAKGGIGEVVTSLAEVEEIFDRLKQRAL